MKKQTYWYQLTGTRKDAGVFWGLNLAVLICVLLILFGRNEAGGAGLVAAFLGFVQAVNLLVTFFSRERRALR